MHHKTVVTVLLAMSLVLGACEISVPGPSALPESPAPTPLPTATQFPTPAEVAPERTFTEVGNVGTLTGAHGVQGKAIVAGLQTLIIQGFTFDGKGPAPDLRLVHGSEYARPAAILAALEPRAYAGEMLLYIIPSVVTRDNADRLVVYAPETGEVYAEATFH